MKFELTGRFNDFTRSAILRSFIIVYFNQRYINDAEIHREFVCLYLHEKIVCRCNRFDHLVQKQRLFFSIFHFIRDYLLTFWYFFIFCRKDLNACDLPGPMSGLHCGGSSWLAPLNFMVHAPVRTIFNPRNELHSSKRVNHMHSERYDKKNEKI